MPLPTEVPVVAEPVVLGEVLSVEPLLGAGVVWLVPMVELFADSELVVFIAAPPVAAIPLHGKPLAPIRPVLLEVDTPPEALPAAPGLAGLLGLAELAAVLGLEVVGLVALGFIVL